MYRIFNDCYLIGMYDAAGDHGVKAQGDGWLTTVTLIEGENIAPTDSGTSNPYVVFTCNGKVRTSSVKLRTSHPSWRGKGARPPYLCL